MSRSVALDVLCKKYFVERRKQLGKLSDCDMIALRERIEGDSITRDYFIIQMMQLLVLQTFHLCSKRRKEDNPSFSDLYYPIRRDQCQCYFI